MRKYTVSIPTVIWYDIEVEAEDYSDAENKARDIFVTVTDDDLMSKGSEANDLLDAYVEEVE